MCALSFPNRISTGIGKIQATPTLRGANERSRTATYSPNPLLPLDLHYSIRNVHPPGTFEYAKFVILFTTFPASRFDAGGVLEWYRARWQVEPVFKRFKSLARLGHLPKYDDESAKAWLYGKLFAALLIEKLIRHASAISPRPRLALGGLAGIDNRLSFLRNFFLSGLPWPYTWADFVSLFPGWCAGGCRA